MMGMAGPGRPIHHAHHLWAACPQEAPHQQRGEDEEGDVEPGRVVPTDRGFDHASVVFRWNEAKRGEDQLYDPMAKAISSARMTASIIRCSRASTSPMITQLCRRERLNDPALHHCAAAALTGHIAQFAS
jgi:hypothetical protein